MSATTPRRNILVTGGCGYIGSHTIVLLLQNNYDVTVVDNLCNSSSVSLERVGDIVGLSPQERKERIVFHNVDICDEAAFRAVFEQSPTFYSCIHFAGLKVSEVPFFGLLFVDNDGGCKSRVEDLSAILLSACHGRPFFF